MSNVFVGSTSYKTIGEALLSGGNIIEITPGVYREQLTIRRPNVILRKKPGANGEVKITWYYGIGQLYGGQPAKNYGAPVTIEEGADNFTAQNITFENSYNLYYTKEELEEGYETDPNPKNSNFKRYQWLKDQIAAGIPDEEINNWLQSKSPIEGYSIVEGETVTPRERNGAFCSYADKVMLQDCKFMATQDTIFINNGRVSFIDCLIAGTYDFICGSAAAHFNNCELHIKAGPPMVDKNQLDEICIAAPRQESGRGFIFYNCTITGSKWATKNHLARPWHPNGEAIFLNTKINNSIRPGYENTSLLHPYPWDAMGGNPPENARFKIEEGGIYNEYIDF